MAIKHSTIPKLSTLFEDPRLRAVFARWEFDNNPPPLPVEPSPYPPKLEGGAVAARELVEA